MSGKYVDASVGALLTRFTCKLVFQVGHSSCNGVFPSLKHKLVMSITTGRHQHPPYFLVKMSCCSVSPFRRTILRQLGVLRQN